MSSPEQSNAPTYSILVPLFKAEQYLPDLLKALESLSHRLNGPLETVFVIDGLVDNSSVILEKELSNTSFRSIVAVHSRNFGSWIAIRSALAQATGTYFAIMSADLQEPPELMLDFFDCLSRDQADLVFGKRMRRGDPLLTRWMSHLFWTFYRWAINSDIPPGGVDVFGCNRVFRARLLELSESHNILVGTLFWIGLRRAFIPYQRRPNVDGKSTWTWCRKIRHATDYVLLYSDFPVQVLMVFGGAALVAAVLGGVFLYAFYRASMPRCMPEFLIALFFSGLNAIGLGILGGYLWRILVTARRWPQAVLMDVHSFAGRR